MPIVRTTYPYKPYVNMENFQKGSKLIPIEIKNSKTFLASFLRGLKYFHKQTSKAEDGVIS